jgi:hypothetical protein
VGADFDAGMNWHIDPVGPIDNFLVVAS